MFKQKSCSWSIYMFYFFLCFPICWNLLSSSFFSSKHKLIKLCGAAAKSLQSCPTLCDPIAGSPPSSPIPGILQARTLEWVAISFSNVWKWKVKVKSLSRVRPLATPWTAAHRLFCPWDFPGKSSGVGCHCLLGKNVLNYIALQDRWKLPSTL